MQSSQAALLLEKSWLCSGFGALALSSKARGSSMSCRRGGPGRGGAAAEPAAPLPEGAVGSERGGPGPSAGHSPAPPRCAPEGSRGTRASRAGARAWTRRRAVPPRADASLLGITPRAELAAGCASFLLCPSQTSGRRCRACRPLPTCEMGLLHRGSVLGHSEGALYTAVSAKHFSARRGGGVNANLENSALFYTFVQNAFWRQQRTRLLVSIGFLSYFVVWVFFPPQ